MRDTYKKSQFFCSICGKPFDSILKLVDHNVHEHEQTDAQSWSRNRFQQTAKTEHITEKIRDK